MSPARWTRGVFGRPYPQRAVPLSTPELPVSAFLRTVAVPWGGALVVLVVGLVEFVLDTRGPGCRPRWRCWG
jgi:hypothetical protein